MMALIPSVFIALAAGLLGFSIMQYTLRLGNSRAGRDENHSKGAWFTLGHYLGSFVCGLMPRVFEKRLSRYTMYILKAGQFPRLEAVDIVGTQVLGALLGGILYYILRLDYGVAGVGAAVLFGLWYPLHRLKKGMTERQEELMREFPYALDMLILCIEGGLDITAGIREIIINADAGPLKDEFTKMLHDIQTGRGRAEALRMFSDRVDPLEIKAVITGIIQSLSLGSGIIETLRTQAEQLRFNRLMRAEEEAQKVPTKMLLPMVLFIFPCVFLVIFTPIIMSMVKSFKGF